MGRTMDTAMMVATYIQVRPLCVYIYIYIHTYTYIYNTSNHYNMMMTPTVIILIYIYIYIYICIHGNSSNAQGDDTESLQCDLIRYLNLANILVCMQARAKPTSDQGERLHTRNHKSEIPIGKCHWTSIGHFQWTSTPLLWLSYFVMTKSTYLYVDRHQAILRYQDYLYGI